MPLIYVKLHAIFQSNGGRIDLFSLKWDYYFIFGFLCLIKSDSDRISTLEPFISQKMGYYTVYVTHLGAFIRSVTVILLTDTTKRVCDNTLLITLKGDNSQN